MKPLLTTLCALALASVTITAVAQSCSTYYDQRTGKYCKVCHRPDGQVSTVVCY
ncbi:hypothetical protein UFOVP381_29 [uncultured Caudovirales phage]|jgi:hypothetical protein|uniref:Uncharacterized protein n=1 Tax=uncultured Caudovirales phage TaxID=2100421 RepID=A0A6J7X2G8_9CAUD|nr:hypothetical protein UFOVP381_29 [uncultured Caudovirales phage]